MLYVSDVIKFEGTIDKNQIQIVVVHETKDERFDRREGGIGKRVVEKRERAQSGTYLLLFRCAGVLSVVEITYS